MRGEERRQRAMLVVIDPERRVPKDHPVRRIKHLADAALEKLSPVFDEMYSAVGRPSIPPERLLKASLLMALYTVRSERMFCERLDYDLMFRWFLDMEMDERSFDHSTFSRNRARLLEHEIAGEFFRAVVEQARALKLLSEEHFTVDGTLVEAWASLKSFRRKDAGPSGSPDDPGNPTVNFHGERRSNATISPRPIPRPFALINRGPVINPSASAVAYSNRANDRCILNLLVLIETGALYQTRRRLSVKYCWPFSIACSCPRHPQPGSPAAFSRSNCETEPTCVRAERHTRTVSNDADIRPSLFGWGAQNRPQGRSFRAVPRRLPRQPDSLAEGGRFEPSGPFESRLCRDFEAFVILPHR